MLVLTLFVGRTAAGHDGIQDTPVMGWSTWYATGGNLSEAVVLGVASQLIKTGLRDAGYVYVNLDDAWLAPTRDRYGKMVGDPGRFPHGIKWLADKLHAMGLKLGLYGDPGIRTCESQAQFLGLRLEMVGILCCSWLPLRICALAVKT